MPLVSRYPPVVTQCSSFISVANTILTRVILQGQGLFGSQIQVVVHHFRKVEVGIEATRYIRIKSQRDGSVRRALVTTPDYLSLAPRIYMMEGEILNPISYL